MRGVSGELRDHNVQLLVGGKRVKVSTADPHHQALLFLRQQRLHILHLRPRLAQLSCQLRPVQWLANHQRLVAAGVTGFAGLLLAQKVGGRAAQLVLIRTHIDCHIGHELRLCLGDALAPGLRRRTCRQQGRILRLCRVVRLEQVHG